MSERHPRVGVCGAMPTALPAFSEGSTNSIAWGRVNAGRGRLSHHSTMARAQTSPKQYRFNQYFLRVGRRYPNLVAVFWRFESETQVCVLCARKTQHRAMIVGGVKFLTRS